MVQQTESYDLQRMSSQTNSKLFGRFDPIHIALAVTSVIFIILSIVFIILFATKHDSSTGFLTTGFSTKSKDDVSNELQSLLKNKYTLNSFAVDLQNNAVNSVFSIRGSVSTDDVQNVLKNAKTMTQVETTYGDKAVSVCRQQQLLPSTAAPPPTTKAPTTPVPTTQPPPVNALYCKPVNLQRDVVIFIDMDDNGKGYTDKVTSLQSLKAKIMHGLNFGSTNVFLIAGANNGVTSISTAFATTSDQFSKDFDNLIKVAPTKKTTSLDLGPVFDATIKAIRGGRTSIPAELIIITDKNPGAPVTTPDPRTYGIYTAVTGVGKKYIPNYGQLVDDVTYAYDSYTDMATADPFSSLICTFHNIPAPNTNFLQLSMDDGAVDTPACEVLDIIIAFDTSESLSSIILPKYTKFAKDLVAQYKYNADVATRIGILTFNSEVTEMLALKDGETLAAVNAVIDKVVYTAGLTDVTKALNTAKAMFDREATLSKGRVLIVLSDAQPTVDTYDDEIAAGQALQGIQVATFFIGYSSYSQDVMDELSKVTKKEYIFGNMEDAGTLPGVTDQILFAYPCPVPKCVTGYFAVEVSEATGDNTIQNLKDVLKVVDSMAIANQGMPQYQLITYNDVGNTLFGPKGDASLIPFKAYVQNLIDNKAQLAAIRRGRTRLDLAMDDITKELASQTTKNARFTADLLFFGQANDAVLDPTTDTTDQRKGALANSALRLKTQTAGRIYVVDDSRPVATFGEDLWTSVTDKTKIIPLGGDVVQALRATTYFTEWSTLSCKLPPLATCFDTPLDVAVIFDMSKQDQKLIDYINQFFASFSSQDDAHFSLAAYGAQPTRVLSNLASHTTAELKDATVTYEEWRNGSYFITTTPSPTTSTSAPSTSTKKPANFWENEYQVGTDTISGVFGVLSQQFGCGHYSDAGDRTFAPNLYIIASDNFGTYTQAVWDSFQTQIHNLYGCWDCAGTPQFLFLSRTDAMAPVTLGATINLSDTDLDIDETDDTSTQINISKFNGFVNSVCGIPLRQCASYTCTRN